ncbi:DUF368 domain-containing protein [Haloplasma contractile]|uniref:Urate oxidase protein n=1 Tax=Haloplasma contractile SSD-17B TaxID=1033810 RepID=U2DWP4_9MOLU|nr:DUF368 domain-containing protein [Haloplasma contractile]ERJ12732.1 urate oxidase protein [Haloplasma contractile SSD-17B]
MIIINFIRGFFMAVADSVPGVSGGTIAFIMGFYDDFINSLDRIVSKTVKLKEKKSAFIFLGKLGFGWIFGMGISVLILSALFEKEIYRISSLFLGLILFSIPLIIHEEKKSLRGKYSNLIFTLSGIVLVSLITYFNPVRSSDAVSLNLTYGIFIFVAGMIAISAMVLPGISGSTILVIFGLYATIITAIKDFMSLELQSLPTLILFGLGVLTGVITIIPLLKYLLANHRSKMIYLILGLMLGSLYAIVMGPRTVHVPGTETYYQVMEFKSFSGLFFFIGGMIIFGLDEMKKQIDKRQTKEIPLR